MTASATSVSPVAGRRVFADRPGSARIDRAFWVVSLIILLSDVTFIYVNYLNSQDVLYENLAAEGQRQETLFALNLHTQGLHMQQVATYLANQAEVRQLFLAGRDAVIAEGGGPGGERAAKLRRALYEQVAPSWKKVAGAYKARQLHFHIGPGDTSFLRVHKPSKFGDDLSKIRHTITHAIRDNRPTHGFESGRVYAGIRGVVPIAVKAPLLGNTRVMGAVEAGSSFNQMLEVLSAGTGITFSVLLDREYFYATHWPDFAARLVRERPLVGDWYIEAGADEPMLRRLLNDERVLSGVSARQPVIAAVNGVDYAVYGFPFRDFLRNTDTTQPPIGAIVAWYDIGDALAAAQGSLYNNILLGIGAFVLIETLLFSAWRLARRRMQLVIDQKTHALSEANSALQEEVGLRMRSERKLKNYQVHLEVQVEERTRSLSETVGALQLEMEFRRSVEQELQVQRDKAQITLRSIVDGVISTDIEGRVQYMNPAAQELTGWSSREAEGRRLDDVFRARDLERSGEPMDFARCLREDFRREHGENTELQRRGGQTLIVEHSLSPIRGEGGEHLGLVLVFHDDTEARELAVQLSYQASHDALTGLVNRRAIEMELGDVLRSCRIEQSSHAFLYIDLDQFKVVNDTCGHVAGDELLRQLAKLLQHKTRQTDSLARLGGDEFGLLLRNCPVENSRRIADELLETVRGFCFVWENRTFRVGASIGVSVIDLHSESVATVLSAADSACYLAKEKGRSRVQLSLPDDGELETRRGEMQWVSRIQQALAEDRLVLFGQPIVPVDGRSDEPPHEEILVRMLDTDGALIPPTAFIPAAERYGLMGEIDRWIVDRSFHMISQASGLWPHESSGTYSINLSGETMADDGILDYIRDRFATYRVDPHRICFEITETAAIANMASAIDLMTELKRDGCRFALDDFGSGLSSFGYLKVLPVDFLKIDGSFVRNLDGEHVDYVMVKAINEVGHAMQLKTIAEFVETEAIFEELRLLGIDYAQGFGVGAPAELPNLKVVNG